MSSKNAITRRGFVKTSALLGAAAAVGVSMSDSLIEAEPSYAAEPVAMEKVQTTCHGCDVACGVIAYVENGVVVKLEGNKDHKLSKGALCMKALNQLHTCYSPRHILHPLRRAGERGENKWEQISWDEALDFAAEQITGIIDKYGPYAFFASVGGGGSYSFMNCITTPMALGSPNMFEPGCSQCWMPRFATALYTYGGNDQGLSAGVAQEPYNDRDDEFTDVLVVWGEQPSIATTAWGGRNMADLRSRGTKTVVIDPNFSPDASKADIWLPIRPHTDTGLALCWFRYILENGLYDEQFCKYWTNLPFFVDPDTRLPIEAKQVWPDYVSPTADNTPAYVCFDARTNSLQPFPYSAPEDSPVDPEVMATATIAVDGVEKECRTAGQVYRDEADEWTLEHTAEVCWLDADKIEEAILLYAEGERSCIAHGVATDQTPQSSEMSLACIGLDMLMGHVLKRGSNLVMRGASTIPTTRPTQFSCGYAGMFGIFYGLGAIIGATDEESLAYHDSFQDKEAQAFHERLAQDRLGMQNHKGLCSWWMSHIPSVLDAIVTGEPYKPRCWYDMSGNKFAVIGNATAWYDALPEIDFIMGQYPNLTSFHIEACDLVLPLREWLEEPLTYNIQPNNYTYLAPQLTHLGETVSHDVGNGQVLLRCQEKWGGSLPGRIEYWMGNLTEGAAKETLATTFGASDYDELRSNIDDYSPKMTEPDETWYTYRQNEVIVDDGLPAGFATPSRKCEPYCSLFVRMSDTGYPYYFPTPMKACEEEYIYSPICKWVAPNEDVTTDAEYPFVLTSGRLPYFHHGTMRHAAYARELYPCPEVKINPRSAAELGIEHQQWVSISSRRGTISARAYLTEGVAPNVVWMERYWNPECFDESQKEQTAGWRECNVNVLTNNGDHFNEVYGSYTLRGITVRIEPGQKPSNIWTEPEEFEPFMPTLMSEPVTEDVF